MDFRYTVWQGGSLVAGFSSLTDLAHLTIPGTVIVCDRGKAFWEGCLSVNVGWHAKVEMLAHACCSPVFWRVVRVARHDTTGAVGRKKLTYGATDRAEAEQMVAYLTQWGEGLRPSEPEWKWTYELVNSVTLD